MKSVSLAIFCGLILMFADTAAAGSAGFKQELDFRPGGQTIGGPGTAEIEVGEFEFIWEAATAPADVCMTVANIGAVLLRIDLAVDSPSLLMMVVPAGQTRTRCGPGVRFTLLNCVGDEKTPRGATCEALWRVDEYHPRTDSNR